MKKLTVGLFTDAFYPVFDGVVRVVDNYARNLTKYMNVIVFAPLYCETFNDKTLPYKVVRCKSFKVPFIDYSLPMPKMDNSFHRELKKYHLDIVHIHSPFTIGETGIKYAKRNHIPVVGTMHSQYKQDFLRAVHNEKIADTLNKRLIRVYNKCDECWAVNSEVARIFYEDYGYKEMPKVMNNATEMEPLLDRKKAYNYINKKYHLNDEKVFIFVGRINALKNIFFIVEVLNEIKKIDSKLSFKMFFVGSGQDEEKLKRKIQEYHLEDNVIMVGKVTNRKILASYYVRSDLFLFPSLYDASSIVQIEAAAQNLPVLFLEGAATTATVQNNINGFIEKNDVSLYAKRVLNILKDAKGLQEVGFNAKRDLYKNWKISIQEVFNEYQKLINNQIR